MTRGLAERGEMVKLMNAMVDALRNAEELHRIQYSKGLMDNADAFEREILHGFYNEDVFSKLDEYDDAFAVHCQRCDFADVSKADEVKLTLRCFTDAIYDVDWSDADGKLYNFLVSVLQESHSALIQIAQTDLSMHHY